MAYSLLQCEYAEISIAAQLERIVNECKYETTHLRFEHTHACAIAHKMQLSKMYQMALHIRATWMESERQVRRLQLQLAMAFGVKKTQHWQCIDVPHHNVGMHFVHTSITMEIRGVDENINKTKQNQIKTSAAYIARLFLVYFFLLITCI